MKSILVNLATRSLRAASAVVVVAAALLILLQQGGSQPSHAQTPLPSAQLPRPSLGPLEPELLHAEGLSKAFRAAARNVLPAVVVIKAGATPVCPRCGRAHEPDEESPHSMSGADHPRSLEILGSGFIVDASGVVLTNQHVVDGARRLVVQTAAGKQYPATSVRTDPEQDVAVLRISPEAPLPAVALGDSDKAEIGDWVLTIGCPLELEQTVSAGIISAKNRSFCARHPTRYLQTDAVVNPGSSGGPLVDLGGKVIGITTSIRSEDGGYQGIGFAVPSSLVKPLLNREGATSATPAPMRKGAS